MKTITEKQIEAILKTAVEKGADDFNWMFTEEEREDRGWIIEGTQVNLDEEEESELHWILEDSETGLTREDVYADPYLLNRIQIAYIEGWNREAEALGLE